MKKKVILVPDNPNKVTVNNSVYGPISHSRSSEIVIYPNHDKYHSVLEVLFLREKGNYTHLVLVSEDNNCAQCCIGLHKGHRLFGLGIEEIKELVYSDNQIFFNSPIGEVGRPKMFLDHPNTKDLWWVIVYCGYNNNPEKLVDLCNRIEKTLSKDDAMWELTKR